MFADTFPVFAATALGALAFLAGGVLSHKLSHFISRHAGPVIAFASGAMLAITFGHVLPEAVEMGGGAAWIAILLGVICFFTLEHFFYMHGCPDHANFHECKNHVLGPLAAIGIGIHSFFDGVIIVFAFLVNPVLGWFATIGIVLHKLPAGSILHALICQHHGASARNLWYIFAVAAATPLAAIFAPLFTNLSTEWIGIGLAFSAGTLLYITLSDLLPETHRKQTKFNLFWLALGIVLIFGLNYFFETHPHTEGEQHEIHEHFEGS